MNKIMVKIAVAVMMVVGSMAHAQHYDTTVEVALAMVITAGDGQDCETMVGAMFLVGSLEIESNGYRRLDSICRTYRGEFDHQAFSMVFDSGWITEGWDTSNPSLDYTVYYHPVRREYVVVWVSRDFNSVFAGIYR